MNTQSDNENFRVIKETIINSKRFNVSVGDLVLVESVNWHQLTGVVSSIKTRKSYLNRPHDTALLSLNFT